MPRIKVNITVVHSRIRENTVNFLYKNFKKVLLIIITSLLPCAVFFLYHPYDLIIQLKLCSSNVHLENLYFTS